MAEGPAPVVDLRSIHAVGADGQIQRSVVVLLVTANVEVGMVRAAAVEPVDQLRVAMDCC